MVDTPPARAELLEMLAEYPAWLRALTAGVAPELLHAPPAEGEWSANEVLAHLRACADMWGGYIEQILAEDFPTFKAMNPATWIKQTDYPQQPFGRSLQAYTAQRAELLAVLRPLAPADWQRAATVTGAGKPRVRTVETYALWLADHERPHKRQFAKILTVVGGEGAAAA